MDKVIPNLKPQAAPIAIQSTGTMTEQGNYIIEQAAAGSLSNDDANAMMQLLTNQSKLIETEIMNQKINDIHTMLRSIENATIKQVN